MVTKHKSYKTLINKIHATTTAAAVDSKEDKLHQLTKNGRSSTVGGCCSILFRVLMYTLLMGVLVAVVLRYQYPQHYNTIKKNTAPLLDHIVESTTPFMRNVQLRAMELCKASQPIVRQMKVKAREIWSVAMPYVDRMTTNVHSIALYVYQKADEVAPQLLEQVGQWYVAAVKYVTTSYNDVMEYLHSPQFQEAVKKVSERSVALIQQVRLGFNSAVTYTLHMIGY